jgi:hypothetical protein
LRSTSVMADLAEPQGVEMDYGKMGPVLAIELGRHGWAEPERASDELNAKRQRSAPGRVAAWKRLVRMFPPQESETLPKGDRRNLDPG